MVAWKHKAIITLPHNVLDCNEARKYEPSALPYIIRGKSLTLNHDIGIVQIAVASAVVMDTLANIRPKERD
jgi:hypothetical protein